MDNKKTDIGEKVMVFIDGSNVYHIIKNLFPDRKPNNLNFKKFVTSLQIILSSKPEAKSELVDSK